MRLFLYIIFSIALVFVQRLVIPVLSPLSITFDIVLLFIVFSSLRCPAWQAVLLAGLSGFMLDMFAPVHAGCFTMGYAFAGFILANSRDSFNLDRPILHGIAIFIIGMLVKIIQLCFYGFNIDNLPLFIIGFFITYIITSLVAIGLDILFRMFLGKDTFSEENDQ